MPFLSLWSREATPQPLDVLCYREDGHDVAHCLEMDLVATASTRDAAVRDLVDVLRAHVRYAVEQDNLVHLFKPAPEEYWAKLANAELIGTLDLDFSGDVPVAVGTVARGRRFTVRELAA